MRNSRLRLFLHWIPALAGITVILVESTATMSAANTSRWLLPLWVKLFGPVSPADWAEIHHYIRKSGHFLGYGSVSLGFFDSWRVTLERWWPTRRTRFEIATGLALLSTVLLASWDEWHQSLLPGRTSTPWDVGIDFCGALAAQLILLALAGIFRRNMTPRMREA